MTTVGRIWSCTTLGGRGTLEGHVIVVHIEAAEMLLIGYFEAGSHGDPTIGMVVECEAEVPIERNGDFDRCHFWRRAAQ